MKKSLDHLPAYKQNEIKYIINQIQKVCRVEFIILYGSYARDDYVELDVTHVKDDKQDHHEEYRSDLDILVIVRNPDFADKYFSKFNTLQSRLTDDFLKMKIRSPVSLIVDDIVNVRERIAEANSFFKDVTEEGIELYSSVRHKLGRVRHLTMPEKRQMTERYFREYTEKAKDSLRTYKFQTKKNILNDASFNLHQATERSLHCILLVFTLYAPKLHDIEKLYRNVKSFDNRLTQIFPRETEEDNRLFELLKASYVDARYSPHFKITKEELKTIAKSVKSLVSLMEEICKKRIESYE